MKKAEKLPILKKRIAEKVIKLKREKHHPIAHHITKKHNISKKTFYCMKEYSPRSHVATIIIKESVKILILASILSSLGGIALHSAQDKIFLVLPLLILLPALNDMIGDFGTIISSKFTTMMYSGEVTDSSLGSKHVKKLFYIVLAVALLSSLYIGTLAYAISMLQGYAFTFGVFAKVIFVSIIATAMLVTVIFVISIKFGSNICRKGEDPNNYLIPLPTSLADLGSLAFLSAMAVLLF